MRPNILLITMDQLRADALGCAGNEVIHTPNIDALASEGVFFSQCLAQSPVCVPSRASLVTGRYPHTCGVIWNFAPLPQYEVILPKLLRSHGYQTAVVGKHHLVGADMESTFHHSMELHGKWAGPAGNAPYRQFVREHGYDLPRFMDDPSFAENLGVYPWALPEELYVDHMVCERAVEYVQELAKPPFFLWVGLLSPHHPYDPPARFASQYDSVDLPMPHGDAAETESKPPAFKAYQVYDQHPFPYGTWGEQTEDKLHRMIAAYYGTVSLCDEGIGRIIKALQEKGELDNTLIVITSDHGDFLGDHGIIAKGPFLYDSLIHVPLLIRGPSCGIAGTTVSEPVELVDIFPTLMDAAGIEISPHVQGHSLWREYQGAEASHRDFCFAETPSQRCVRCQEWKFIRYVDHSHRELYHLGEDPHELRNVADQFPNVVAEMEDALCGYDTLPERFLRSDFWRFSFVDPETGTTESEFYTY